MEHLTMAAPLSLGLAGLGWLNLASSRSVPRPPHRSEMLRACRRGRSCRSLLVFASVRRTNGVKGETESIKSMDKGAGRYARSVVYRGTGQAILCDAGRPVGERVRASRTRVAGSLRRQVRFGRRIPPEGTAECSGTGSSPPQALADPRSCSPTRRGDDRPTYATVRPDRPLDRAERESREKGGHPRGALRGRACPSGSMRSKGSTPTISSSRPAEALASSKRSPRRADGHPYRRQGDQAEERSSRVRRCARVSR